MLVEDFHSTTVATIGADGHPQTRVIDMMLWDEAGVYFLTAKGKAFYDQLMEQKFVAVSATKDKKAISLRGEIQNIGYEKLDEIFEKNTYMQKIYPGETRSALQVFRIADAQGECETNHGAPIQGHSGVRLWISFLELFVQAILAKFTRAVMREYHWYLCDDVS